MKKILQLFFVSFALIGCSSIQLTEVTTSDTEAKRILSMGLTHEENLNLARNIRDSELILGVISRLEKAENEKNASILESDSIEKYSELVEILEPDIDNQTVYVGSKVNGSLKGSLFNSEKDLYSYFLTSTKDKNGVISHVLQFKVEYKSDNWRNYASVSLCDKWRCNEDEKIDILIVSIVANGCSSSSCKYTESLKFVLGKEQINKNMSSDLIFRINSDNGSNKILVSSAYLKASIQVIK